MSLQKSSYKTHIGFYPVTSGVAEAFGEELAPYKRGKGTLQFRLGQSVPTDLICRIVEFRVKENKGEASSQV
jgi:uncharacterized protein YdhG (YjbR/CyaY superfamily)